MVIYLWKNADVPWRTGTSLPRSPASVKSPVFVEHPSVKMVSHPSWFSTKFSIYPRSSAFIPSNPMYLYIFVYIYIDTVYVCFMILSYLKLLSHIFTTYSSHIPPCILCTYMYIYMYIYVYIYVYICIYIYPSIHPSIYPSIHPSGAYMRTCIHAYIPLYSL